METILRFLGTVFLSVANAIGEAKDAVDSFYFDVLLEGSHLGARDRIAPTPIPGTGFDTRSGADAP
jgi:hypothetical protein